MGILIFITFITFSFSSFARPAAYTELLDYVSEAPDQGETNTCLYVASTGAIELLANKIHNIKNPQPFGRFDLAESFTINAPITVSKSFIETPVLKYNQGYGIHIRDWPFEAWRGTSINKSVWYSHPQYYSLPRIEVPKVETIKLFLNRNRWATYVLDDEHIEMIKQALWKHKSPVIVNYNDENYWHVVLIVGYDDNLPGECYDTDPDECAGNSSSFYVRDSFGIKVELRNTNWFKVKGNAAAVVKLAN
jgi:hypothetical protein